MYHNIFIHSAVDEHLSCLHILAATVNSAAMNPRVYISFQTMLSSGYILQARLQQYVNHELPDVQARFRKGKGTKDQIANIS